MMRTAFKLLYQFVRPCTETHETAAKNRLSIKLHYHKKALDSSKEGQARGLLRTSKERPQLITREGKCGNGQMG